MSMFEANPEFCGPTVELDLRDCRDDNRMKLTAAEKHLIPLLEQRGYIVEPWGVNAVPPQSRKLMHEWQMRYPRSQSRTGQPNRLRWTLDLFVSDPQTHVQFAIDVKVKRGASRLDDWIAQKQAWDAQTRADDDEFADELSLPKVSDIETISIELDSLWTFRKVYELAAGLPTFIACYIPVGPISESTNFHLMGTSVHDAIRDRRYRRDDNRGKNDTAGSGTPFVYLPICQMTPHHEWDTKLFFRSSK